MITGKVLLKNPNPAIAGFNPTTFDFEINDTPPAPNPSPISDVTIYNSPTDIATWNETRKIIGLEMNPNSGFTLEFDQPLPDSWKWFTGPPPHSPDSDNYQYTIWPVISINGAWYSSGIVQMWQGRPNTGAFELATWHDEFHKNWCYDSRWGQMSEYYPNPGDKMGLFVSAGNARGMAGITSVKERSNIVEVVLPLGDIGSWMF